jgi:DNA primase
VLPDGLDPDDFVRQHGAEAFQHRIEDAPDFVSFYLETTAERARTIEGRTEVARELFAILANITDELRKDQYIERISHGLNISRWACRREFDRYIRQQSSKIPEPEQPAQSGLSDTARQHDVSFLALLLQNEAMFDLAKHELAGLELGNGPLEDNLRLLLDTQHGGSTALSQRLASEEARRLYAAASTSTPVTDVKTAENMVLHRLARMKKDKLQAEARALQESLQEARRARDDARQLQLLARIVEMERRIEVSR